MLTSLEAAITRFWYYRSSYSTMPKWQYGLVWFLLWPLLLGLSFTVYLIARKRQQRCIYQTKRYIYQPKRICSSNTIDQTHSTSSVSEALASKTSASKSLTSNAITSPLPPIIVVGNMTIGGTGKTPLILALSLRLRQEGFRVGIISRGYGATPPHVPFEVTPDSDIKQSGDEPKMLAQLSHCPVVIDPKRVQAAEYLHQRHTIDVILSDDGLQHVGLPRALEILVCDGDRQFGNGFCLPAGPLREPLSRLDQVNFIVQTSRSFVLPRKPHAPTAVQTLLPTQWVNVATGQTLPLKELMTLKSLNSGANITAVTGIGNPERFFSSLTALGLSFKPVSYPDHYDFKPDDLLDLNDSFVIMTAKDAVKCQSFAQKNWWYLQVEACLPEEWYQQLFQQLATLTRC